MEPWTKPSTTPSPSLAEGLFTVTHPFHPLYGQQFEILTCRHNWGEYRITFYDTPDHIRGLPAAWTSMVPPDLVAEVGLGHVGLVMGLEVSRLARSFARLASSAGNLHDDRNPHPG